jgi:hypothetical protein
MDPIDTDLLDGIIAEYSVVTKHSYGPRPKGSVLVTNECCIPRATPLTDAGQAKHRMQPLLSRRVLI